MKTKSTLRFGLKPPGSPVTGAAASMDHRHDLNRRIGNAIDYTVREAAQRIFPCAVQMPGPPLRIIAYGTDGVIERPYKSASCRWISFRVPEKGGSRFGHGVGMEVNAWRSHASVRGSGGALPTRERSLPFPRPDRQCGAQSLCSMPPRRPHPPSHLNFRSNGQQARRGRPRAGAELLPQPFCELASWNKFYNSLSPQDKL